MKFFTPLSPAMRSKFKIYIFRTECLIDMDKILCQQDFYHSRNRNNKAVYLATPNFTLSAKSRNIGQ